LGTLRTPDSSRFWAAPVTVGKEQDSFDKQYVRNYLTSNGLKGKPGVVLPDEVVENTANKYREVFKMLTGQTLQEALAKLES
jgi:phosphoribosylaminoimidazole-succinocarboxamide synthase